MKGLRFIALVATRYIFSKKKYNTINLITGISAELDDLSIVFHLKTMGFVPKVEMAVEKSDLMQQIYNRDVKFSCE